MKNNSINIFSIVKTACPYIIFALQLYILDFTVRSFDDIDILCTFPWWLPNTFTLSFIFLFTGIVASLKGWLKKIIYFIIATYFTLLAITQIAYYFQTSFAFSFQILWMSNEGAQYMYDSIISLIQNKPLSCTYIAITIILIPINIKIFKKQQKFYTAPIVIGFILFIILNCACLYNCGIIFQSDYDSVQSQNINETYKDLYKKFEDRYACIKIGGFYEYTLRDFVVQGSKISSSISPEKKVFLDSQCNEELNTKNSHSGIFEGKNVIFLQLEGMDTWLLTKETTPNLYALKNDSIDFVNHYSNATGGGSTINNEMAVNTGFYMPFGTINSMNFLLENNFNITLPKQFAKAGYKSNVFHMNKGEFYKRQEYTEHLGYENYFGLQDTLKYTTELELDRNLITNNDFYKKMFDANTPFLHYLITYTPHTPYRYAGKDKLLMEEKFGDKSKDKLNSYSASDYAKLDAKETDNMVGLLIQALKDNSLYDNTVIVAFADHYQYSIDTKSETEKEKGSIRSLANLTPFFIWSKNCPPEKIDKVNMQIDIMPTVLNMFGIDYNKNYIIGHDIFDDSFLGVAFFHDKSYFDGTYYYINNEVYAIDSSTKEKEKVNYANPKLKNYVTNQIAKNNLILVHNYFSK